MLGSGTAAVSKWPRNLQPVLSATPEMYPIPLRLPLPLKSERKRDMATLVLALLSVAVFVGVGWLVILLTEVDDT
jgi:hypothetical protein